MEVDEKEETTLSDAKLYDYRLKFSTEYSVSGFNNSVLMTKWQPYGGGNGPIYLTNGNSNLSGIIRIGVSDLFEDIKFIGGFRLGLNLDDKDVLFSFYNLRKRLDWGLTFYRSTVTNFYNTDPFTNKLFTNIYQVNLSYPIDKVRSIRANIAYRNDRGVIKTSILSDQSLKVADTIMKGLLTHIEYVHDNTINPALNIWHGLRYKVYMDLNSDLTKKKGDSFGYEVNTFNLGTDIRYYYPIYRNFIWAGRAAADISWGPKKIAYFLGGTDSWLWPKFNNSNTPAPDNTYTYQSLAVNMRGYKQNAANGNNAIVLNSEFRLPVFTTLLSRPINNAFIRNFQVIQFIDLGSAWNGKYSALNRPAVTYGTEPVQVVFKSPGVGPFVGGYGFGARSTLLGYFLRVDAGWPMSGFFNGKPIWYFSLGLDF